MHRLVRALFLIVFVGGGLAGGFSLWGIGGAILFGVIGLGLCLFVIENVDEMLGDIIGAMVYVVLIGLGIALAWLIIQSWGAGRP